MGEIMGKELAEEIIRAIHHWIYSSEPKTEAEVRAALKLLSSYPNW